MIIVFWARTDCGVFLNDHVKLVLAASENLGTVVKRARVLLDSRGEASEVGLLLRALDNQTKDIETQVKEINVYSSTVRHLVSLAALWFLIRKNN